MKRRRSLCSGFGVVVALLLGIPAAAAELRSDLFENVAELLAREYYDKDFRAHQLPALVAEYRPQVSPALSLADQRRITHEFLSQVPVTHLALLSRDTYRRFTHELGNEEAATFGFEVIERDGAHYAYNILEGGPADRAGLRRWDRVVSIDGVPAGRSARLDWRSDDAFLPDPPIRGVVGAAGDVLKLKLERHPGEVRLVAIESAPYSSFEAARASARVFTIDGRRIGYVHFWLVHHRGADELLKTALDEHCTECDGFVLDLRGRGGSASMIRRLLRVISGRRSSWEKPIVALIDRHTRSAKEILAYEIRERGLGVLVGERTTGAVIAARFERVGSETYLMFPAAALTKYTPLLELTGVEPDIDVEDAGPYSAGDDPILLRGLQAATVLAEGLSVSD